MLSTGGCEGLRNEAHLDKYLHYFVSMEDDPQHPVLHSTPLGGSITLYGVAPLRGSITLYGVAPLRGSITLYGVAPLRGSITLYGVVICCSFLPQKIVRGTTVERIATKSMVNHLDSYQERLEYEHVTM